MSEDGVKTWTALERIPSRSYSQPHGNTNRANKKGRPSTLSPNQTFATPSPSRLKSDRSTDVLNHSLTRSTSTTPLPDHADKACQLTNVTRDMSTMTSPISQQLRPEPTPPPENKLQREHFPMAYPKDSYSFRPRPLASKNTKLTTPFRWRFFQGGSVLNSNTGQTSYIDDGVEGHSQLITLHLLNRKNKS